MDDYYYTNSSAYTRCRNVIFAKVQPDFDAAITRVVQLFNDEVSRHADLMWNIIVGLVANHDGTNGKKYQTRLQQFRSEEAIFEVFVHQGCMNIMHMLQEMARDRESQVWTEYQGKTPDDLMLFVARHDPTLLLTQKTFFAQSKVVRATYPELLIAVKTVKSLYDEPAEQVTALRSWMQRVNISQSQSLPENLTIVPTKMFTE